MPPSVPEQVDELRQRVVRLEAVLNEVVGVIDDITVVLITHAEDREHSGDQYRERTKPVRKSIAARMAKIREQLGR